MTNIYRRKPSSNCVVLFFAGFLLAVTCITVFMPISLICAADGSRDRGPVAISLIDRFSPAIVEGTPDQVAEIPRTEWHFDRSKPYPSNEISPSTLGWQVGAGVNDLKVNDGLLVGRTTSKYPFIHVGTNFGIEDTLYALEIRMRVSKGTNLNVLFGSDGGDSQGWFARKFRLGIDNTTSPIVADDEIKTYVLKGSEIERDSIKQIAISPTDVEGAVFQIESLRLIFYKEHLASIPSGVVWHDQSRVFRQTLVSKTPEVIRFPVTLPDRPWLDLALGTVDENPVSFQVNIAPSDPSAENESLLEHTINTPHQWEPLQVDLSKYAGQDVKLSLSLTGRKPGTLGLWGSPVIRNKGSYPATPVNDRESLSVKPPRGVILIWADMLRWDHLNVYGYHRETAPVIKRMADEGTLFYDCLSQAPWTLPSTTSVLTSLYPTTHGVTNMYNCRLPDEATTLAEVFRDAGYATLSFSSMHYSGSHYNLGQGFEELHESNSAEEARESSGGGTAREYVNQLLPWLNKHREVPFFVFLHTFEPKGNPYPPHDTLWITPEDKERYKKYNSNLPSRLTPNRVRKAGIDPDEFMTMRKDLYDGMIHILDTEIGRLFEGLKELGLHDNTLVILMSDHGEEFFDHGETTHHGSYSEVTHVPLIVRWPDVIPQGMQVHETVRTIDVMPTILQLCRLPVPRVAQGQSLLPLFAKARGTSDLSSSVANKAAIFTTAQWRNEPAVCESYLAGRENRGNPNYRDSHAIILDGWKLIQFFRNDIFSILNAKKPDRIELYDHRKDPLDEVNLADKHPEIVERMIREFKAWKQKAAAASLASDSESEQKLDSETLKRLRSLGYLR